MDLDLCCDKVVRGMSPKVPKEGTFQERRQCPTCKKALIVEFQCGGSFGGLLCSAVGAEYAS